MNINITMQTRKIFKNWKVLLSLMAFALSAEFDEEFISHRAANAPSNKFDDVVPARLLKEKQSIQNDKKK